MENKPCTVKVTFPETVSKERRKSINAVIRLHAGMIVRELEQWGIPSLTFTYSKNGKGVK